MMSMKRSLILRFLYQGSIMADIVSAIPGVTTFNKSIEDMTYWADSEVKFIGKPANYTRPFGIISGTRDMKVLPSSSVELPDMVEGTDYFLESVSASHPGLRKSREALELILKFFQDGRF